MEKKTTKWWNDRRILLWREPNYKKEITGNMFNQKYVKDLRYKFVKLTTFSENHNGYQFKNGLNIDTIDFNTNMLCTPGGIYFINKIHMIKWLTYNKKVMYWYREVTIPNNARIYIEDCKFKTNMLILGPRKQIITWCHSLSDVDRKKCKKYYNEHEIKG